MKERYINKEQLGRNTQNQEVDHKIKEQIKG